MQIKYIVLHHSALNSLEFSPQFNIINNGHKFRNWGTKSKPIYAGTGLNGFYTQYHYFIESNGEVKAGRTEKEVGWHSGNREVNNSSLGICLAGNFDEELPTKEQEATLTKLLKELKLRYPNAEVKFHRDIKPTHCPGLKILDNWHKNNIMKTDEKKLKQIYNEIVMRDYDDNAKGYLGKEEEFVRSEVGKSEERMKIINLVNSARELNN